MSKNEFGRLLRKYRKDAGLSQEKLRQRLEDAEYKVWGHANISKWESGRAIPKEAIIEELEQILRTPRGLLLDAAGKHEVAEYRRIASGKGIAISSDESIEVGPDYGELVGEEKERAIAHDVATFEKSDMIVKEEYITKLVGRVIFSECYQEADLRRLYDFVFFFSYEGNKYLLGKLREVTEKLCYALEDLLVFITDAAGQEPGQQYSPDYQHLLWPDLFDDLRSEWKQGEKKIKRLKKARLRHKAEDVEEEMVDMFSEQIHRAKELHDELSRNAMSVLVAYREYRAHIRQMLYV